MAARKTPSNGGKPDKFLREALMLAMHREVVDEDGTRRKRFHILADKLADLACSGDLPAIKEAFDRIEGKPAQAVEHSGTITTLSSLVEASMSQSDAASASKTSVH